MVVTLGSLRVSTGAAVAVAAVMTAGTASVHGLAIASLEGIAMQTAAIKNLPVFVVNGDHLEEFLPVTLSPARHTFSSFQPSGGQFRFRNDRSGAIEIRSYVIHN